MNLIIRGATTEVEASEISVIDIVRAYARLRLQGEADAPVEQRRILAMTLRDALEALGQRVGELDEWTELFAWAGQSARGQGVSARSQAAASFVAALEMARRGEVELKQDGAFKDVRVSRR